jgi:hypothetical protein
VGGGGATFRFAPVVPWAKTGPGNVGITVVRVGLFQACYFVPIYYREDPEGWTTWRFMRTKTTGAE